MTTLGTNTITSGNLEAFTPAGSSFPVSADSPFADGYDIASERDALADLVAAANPDESDPRWSRFVLLCEREQQLRRANPTRKANGYKSATHQVTPGLIDVGRLVDQAPDTMTLHTKEAFGAFAGRRPDAQGKGVHIGGGKRFAAVLKAIWALSANDNPYADWLLIAMHDRLSEVRSTIEGATVAKQKLIDLARTQGLNFSVMLSRKPKVVELGFRSPYGYATADVIVVFDYHVRLVKTLMHKDRISENVGRQAIREAGRELRALFLEPIRWERFLVRPEMKALCRADFLASADEAGKNRAAAAVALFGEVPPPIFIGERVPRHSRRQAKRSQSNVHSSELASSAGDEPADADESTLL